MSDRSTGSGPILLTGTSGQVGGQLLLTLAPFGEIVAPLRHEMDLSHPDSVREMIRTVRPRWIVNPGAYTAVDKAESEPEIARAVNRDTVAVMGEEAQKLGAAVIHFSTDYVFPGLGTTPYLETDEPAPMSVYGATKLAGEQALAASGAAHLIFRTSWVYGATGKNFLRTILKLARERETLRIVADQHGAPTWDCDLARMVASVMEQCEARASIEGTSIAEVVNAVSGVYHAAGAGETTWHGFASEAVRQMQQKEPATRFAILEGIATSEYPTPANRPANSRLNCGKLERSFGWKMPEWQQSLRSVIAEL
ncbi:dTDP-4-dehydrorhamnose reductase [Granulicella arctica]|uniref:dTDP-4-dehydrorhamnose reductase n=1 Tax=Granulicella arctica TaxID=940613 RepID=A0A7Y9TEZ4_9BACT|nr:dTDP-4-dehydrorhamnose reductase [Granulicella arctica]NYF78206.1 dTDP-4-dehydrorhamnose reductase [Granulicella arctica]